MIRSLDQKLAAIHAAPRTARDFILADAKDADMAFGVRAPGPRSYLARHGARPAQFSPEVWTRDEYGYRNLPEFLDIIREVVHQGLVDIMLMSAYVNEQLTIKEGLFQDSPITPAARANDTTDVWAVRHGWTVSSWATSSDEQAAWVIRSTKRCTVDCPIDHREAA